MIPAKHLRSLCDDRALLRDAQSYLRRRVQDKAPIDQLARRWVQFHCLFSELLNRFAADFDISPSEQDDVVQSVWLQVHKGSVAFPWDEDPSGFRGYLYAMIRSRARDVVRRRKRIIASSLKVLRALPDPRGDASAELERRFSQRLVEKTLEDLRGSVPESTYRVFMLLEVEHRSVAEVAAELGLAPETVSTRRYRMRANFRARVAPYFEDLK